MSSIIEGYDAILVKGQPRFRKDRKMVPAVSVPADIKTALTVELINRPQEPVVLQSPADVQKATEVPTEAGVVSMEPQLEAADFEATDDTGAIPTAYEMELIEQLESLKAQLVENQSVKTNLKLSDLGKEMYKRFGVYTVFAGEHPQLGDTHPFTGQPMNRYEMGLAYQSFRKAQATGILDRDFANEYKALNDSRDAIQAHTEEAQQRRENPGLGMPKYESFAERTSVAGQNRQSSTRLQARPNDPISEDITAEPENGTRGQTIRPSW